MRRHSFKLTPGVTPAGHPAVLSWLEDGFLARQACVADEVGREDVGGGLHQGDVIIQLTVCRVTEVLMPVDTLHREDPLGRFGAPQLVLAQYNPPRVGVLCLPPGIRTVDLNHLNGEN